MRIDDEEIVAGYGIGAYILGMTYDDLIKLTKQNIIGQKNPIGMTIAFENAKFWFNQNNMLYQIMVFGKFYGKYQKVIGIGSTLDDIEKKIGCYGEEDAVYILLDYPGICFELMDIDDWEEKISIYPMKK